jgi:hypothetical protein
MLVKSMLAAPPDAVTVEDAIKSNVSGIYAAFIPYRVKVEPAVIVPIPLVLMSILEIAEVERYSVTSVPTERLVSPPLPRTVLKVVVFE